MVTSSPSSDRTRLTRFVLFDLYDTLIEFDRSAIHAARERLRECLGVSPADIERAERETLRPRMQGAFGDSLDDELREILRTAGAPVTDGQVSQFRESELRAWRDATIVHQDVMPCLHELRGQGIRLGLVSNCSRLTRPLLQHWPFDGLFDAVILSCEERLCKPDPAILRLAVERMGGQCDQGMLVDDREDYVRAASDCGLVGLRIARTQLLRPSGHRVISDLRELTVRLAGVDGR